MNSLDTIIIFNDKNIHEDTLELIEKGNNLKTIIIAHEDNFESFIEDLSQFQELFQKIANELGMEFAQEIYGELVEVFTQSQKLNYSIYFNLSQEKATEWAKSLIKFMVSELDFNLKMTKELLNDGKGFKYELSKIAANEFTTGINTFCLSPPEMEVFRRREIINPRKRKNEFTQRQEA